MYLVLVRHGESTWNLENRFTGWMDVPLTKKGEEDAENAGKLLKEKGILFDVVYTSVLQRAICTWNIIQKELNTKAQVIQNWHLNERHYGALQGLNKDEMRKKYGEEQVFLWRRSFAVRPPALSIQDERSPLKDPKYKDLTEDEIPVGESLKDTMGRTLSYYLEEIKPQLEKGKNVLIVAHGNSLRSILKFMENIEDDDIANVEIPLGIPYVYELNEKLEIQKKYYLSKE